MNHTKTLLRLCSELQENLVRSHAAGTGEPLSLRRTRMLLALRINVLAKGYSGISRANLEKYIAAFNGEPRRQRLFEPQTYPPLESSSCSDGFPTEPTVYLPGSL